MKRLNASIACALLFITALLPTAASAEPAWSYTDDQEAGLIVYTPAQDHQQYINGEMSLEFDIKMNGKVGLDVFVVDYRDAMSVVKRFDVLGAVKQQGSDRYKIELDISDLPEGYYTLVFGVVSASGQVVSEMRNFHIVPGRWDTDNGEKYYYTNGAYAKGSWQHVADKWYRFDDRGAMLSGWQRLDGRWYYFAEQGHMYTGWQHIDDSWFCFGESGAMFENCWVVTAGKWYMVDKKGAMLTGWQKDGGKFYYLNTISGEMHTGWLQLGDKSYYLLPSGAMATGVQEIDGKQYRFDRSGILLT